MDEFKRKKLGPATAYAIAVKNGFEGTEEEWLTSLKGEKGDMGEVGPRGEAGPQDPADWAAAEGEPGHVLNRTHYKDIKNTVVVPKSDVELKPYPLGSMGTLGYAKIGSFDFAYGETYTVIYNDKRYDVQCLMDGELGHDMTSSGWSSAIPPFYFNSQGMLYIGDVSSGTIEIEVYRETLEIHPLSPELGGVPEATAEDVDKILTAGENGPEWKEPAAVGWNALEDKPFGTIEAGTTITWDGDTTDLVNVQEAFYKVSDWTSSRPPDSYIGAICTYSGGGKEVVTESMVGAPCDGLIVAGYTMLVLSENVEYNGITFPESGVYFLKSGEAYMTEFVISEWVVEIEAKYLPSEAFVAYVTTYAQAVEAANAGRAVVYKDTNGLCYLGEITDSVAKFYRVSPGYISYVYIKASGDYTITKASSSYTSPATPESITKQWTFSDDCLLLKSSGGKTFKIVVSDDGALTAAEVTE